MADDNPWDESLNQFMDELDDISTKKINISIKDMLSTPEKYSKDAKFDANIAAMKQLVISYFGDMVDSIPEEKQRISAELDRVNKEYQAIDSTVKDKGMVFMDNEETLKLLHARMLQEIGKGLPIPKGEIPAEITAFAKGIKLEMPHNKDVPRKADSRYSWVEKLLKTPIADVRHRTVNLILAPYFVNVKRAGIDEATAKISDYISLCKELNPDTNINQSYIRYQCSYAKSKGLRPLSLRRARELFGDAISW